MVASILLWKVWYDCSIACKDRAAIFYEKHFRIPKNPSNCNIIFANDASKMDEEVFTKFIV